MFAAALAARFNPVVGCTRSLDTADPTDFQVIIDNMMNLEVLFNAADLTGNDTLREIAKSHADKTMINHIRADGAPPRNLIASFIATSLQGRHFMSLSTIPRLALSSRSARCRGTPTRALGAVVKHGVFMASLTVGDRTHSLTLLY